jgi:hypothetical protein
MSKSDIVDDCVLELRTLARLIETNAPVVWREQDGAQLREAADKIQRLRKALSGLVRHLESCSSYRSYEEENYEEEDALLSAARAALKGKGLWQPRMRAIDTTNSE